MAPTSRFPQPRDSEVSDGKITSVRLDDSQLIDIFLAPRQGGRSLLDLAKIAWAITLAEFNDSNAVEFGVVVDNIRVEKWRAVIAAEREISKAVSLERLREQPIAESAENERLGTCIVWHEMGKGHACCVESHQMVYKHFTPGSNPFEELVGDVSVFICTGSTPQISIRSCASVMDNEFALGVLTTMATVLSCLANNPLQPLLKSAVMSKHGFGMIRKWNSGSRPDPLDCCIQTLFQARCMLQGESPAVCAWDGNFTYNDLDILSSKVHARLAEQGAGPESIVPLLFRKSKWAIVAMLGVLKAGGAFLLLDPSYPAGRLRDICQSIGSGIMLSSGEGIADNIMDNVLIVGDDILSWETLHARRPHVTSRNAAYVVYTSGSTGKPKGIVIEHGSFCFNALATSKAQNLNNSSRVLQFASYAFDVSIHECLTPLLLGGCVCIPSDSQRINSLKEVVKEMRINWIELTPSVARLLHPEDIPTVKTLVLGGEAMSPKDVARWTPHLHLISAYGPAECTVVSAIESGVMEPGNIGRSFGGTTWIVNKENHHQLMPVGAIGELIIGGPLVGRGYFGQPNQTAMAFIRNPDWAPLFSIDEEYRFYKTGDLARYKSDGSLVFVGRKDDQIKLDGNRIELGEIENQAQQAFEKGAVAAALVTPLDGKAFLALFMAEKQEFTDATPDSILCKPSSDYRRHASAVKYRLESVLPSHMVPRVYIPLLVMPLSKTGKVNRRMLGEIVGRLSNKRLRQFRLAEARRGNPLTESYNELKLRGLFAAALRLPVEEVGVDDDFLLLGLDSITAIDVVGRAQEIGVPVTVELIFQHPSINQLAKNIQNLSPCCSPSISAFRLLESGKVEELIAYAAAQCHILPNQVEDIYPCTPLQEAVMACTAKDPGIFQATFHYQLPSEMDIERFRRVFLTVCEAIPILRTRIIQSETFGALQVVVKSDKHCCQSQDKEDGQGFSQTMSYGTSLVQSSISDERIHHGPLVVSVTMHHAMFDGWSHALLLKRIEEAMGGSKLPKQHFSPFIKHITSLDMDVAREFWKSEFHRLRDVAFPGARLPSLYVPKDVTVVTRKIKLSKSPSNSTASNALRLAFALLISSYTESSDVVFGVTVSGRNALVRGIHDLIGPTIATFPLRTVLQPDSELHEELKRMQDHTTRLIPFEQTGLQRIKSFGEDAAAAAKFQSLLVIQPPASPDGSKLFSPLPENDNQQLKFLTCPLTLVAELGDLAVSAKVVFDGSILFPQSAMEFLERFESLVRIITDVPETKVREVTTFRKPIALVEDHSDSSASFQDREEEARYYLGNNYSVVVDEIAPKGSSGKIFAIFVLDKRMFHGGPSGPSIFTTPEKEEREIFSGLMEHLKRTKPAPVVLCLPIRYMPQTINKQPDRERLCFEASKLTWTALKAFMDPKIIIRQESVMPSQMTIQRIIGQVLGLKIHGVPLDDDFFTLGGDSISAMQVVALCRKEGILLTSMDILGAKEVGLIASTKQSGSGSSTPASRSSNIDAGSIISLGSVENTEQPEDTEAEHGTYLGVANGEIEDVYPCTPAHQGLLVTQTLQPFTYQSYTVWEVTVPGSRSPVSPERLSNAWSALVRRHSALRTELVNNTTIKPEGSRYHIVRKPASPARNIIPCPDEDAMRILCDASPEADTAATVPSKFTVCHTNIGRVLCKLEGSLAFLDGTSVMIILQELAQAYAGTLPLTPGPSYRRAVEYFSNLPNANKQLEYWKARMEGIEPCLFPTIQTLKSPKELRTLNMHLGDIENFTRACTPKTFSTGNIFQVAWGMVLRHYTNCNNVCFGEVISGRSAPIFEIESTVGSFFNVLVCGLRFSEGDCLLDILDRNQREIANRQENQYCSLIDVLQLSSHFGTRLFNTCLSVEQQLSLEAEQGGLCFKELKTQEPTEYDIISIVRVGKSKLELQLTYWSSLMGESQAIEVAGMFKGFVEVIVDERMHRVRIVDGLGLSDCA
ncbi:NRPS [Emmonsiellopsis sp. PD_5]|nr:NRPS [Emmonsiellopsis sp. PD_5]